MYIIITIHFVASLVAEIKYSMSPDDDIFRHLSSLYSNAHDNMYLNNAGGFVNGTTNGANWYPINGRRINTKTSGFVCVTMAVESNINHKKNQFSFALL